MADKTKSIKEQTDKELDELLVRLSKELRAQEMIGDLKRRSTPPQPYNPYAPDTPRDFSVSTEQPVEGMYHHGILGMHWGVRRKRGADGRVIEGTRASEDHAKARELQKRGVKNLSNAELKSYVERMNLEGQYAKLNKKEVGAGQKFIQDVLVNSGKQALTTFAAKQMTTQLENITKKKK